MQNGSKQNATNVHNVRWAPSTMQDKGLFDARELGYIY